MMADREQTFASYGNRLRWAWRVLKGRMTERQGARLLTGGSPDEGDAGSIPAPSAKGLQSQPDQLETGCCDHPREGSPGRPSLFLAGWIYGMLCGFLLTCSLLVLLQWLT